MKEQNTPTQASDVWIQAWCSVANAVNCINTEAAERWADKALEAYKKRFPISSNQIDPSLHQMD